MTKVKKYFWNDEEGLSQKDWLLLWSSLIFFGFVAIGLISVLIGKPIDATYIELLKMVTPVLMSIVAGVFGLNIAHEFRKPKETNTYDQEQQKQQEYYDDRI